jgi:hypothetical protein
VKENSGRLAEATIEKNCACGGGVCVSDRTRRLLSVSRSTPLLIGRNDMLAIAGYSVSSPREPLDGIVLLEHDRYLAVLIGHTVLTEEAEEIAEKAKSLGVAAIFVHQGGATAPEWAELSVNTDSEIARLLKFLDGKRSVA